MSCDKGTISGNKRKLLNQGLPREQKEILQSYPRELTQQFQPLYCALCDVKLTSNSTALMHYNSKNHKKKVNNYLEQWAQKTGQPLPKKLCTEKALTEEVQLHCEACDLHLTSKQHAQQHYMGKSHRMVIDRRRDPAGSGYYKDGKWIRMEKAKVDPTGRFGIGLAFLNKANDASSVEQKAEVKSSSSTTTPAVEGNNPLYCTVCQISVTSAPQMTSHVNGTKHKKKLNQSKGALLQDVVSEPVTDPMSTTDDQASSVNGDISMFRTPSGSFFCRSCNVSLTNDQQFRIHLNGKKHNRKRTSENILKDCKNKNTPRACT